MNKKRYLCTMRLASIGHTYKGLSESGAVNNSSFYNQKSKTKIKSLLWINTALRQSIKITHAVGSVLTLL